VTAIVIDTNAYIGLVGGKPGAVEAVQAAEEIHVPLIVLGELLAGFSAGTRLEKNRDELAQFMALPGVEIMKLDEKTAQHYADIFLALRKQGRPIPTNDMWIAALARQHRLPLLSFDTHFAMVPGLVHLDPAA